MANSTSIPTISPLTTGPLGLVHLPRLWQKCILAAHGRLAEGYKHVGPGFDHWLLDGLGVDHEAVKTFFAETKPTYPQFEAWIAAYPGVRLDAPTKDAIRAKIENYEMPPERREAVAAYVGIPADTALPAPAMVELDSWMDFHQSL